MKQQRFLPTPSLHHLNIFIKLSYLKKQFIIYSPENELHHVKRSSVKSTATLKSVWSRSTSFLKSGRCLMSGQRWPIGREIQKTMSHFIARGEAFSTLGLHWVGCSGKLSAAKIYLTTRFTFLIFENITEKFFHSVSYIPPPSVLSMSTDLSK